MRFILTALLAALCLGGCASNPERADAREVVASTGLAEAEVTALGHQASERHHRPIAWVRMSATVPGAIEVGLSDQPGSLHGIVVFFRKVDGRWEEDPKLQMDWTV